MSSMVCSVAHQPYSLVNLFNSRREYSDQNAEFEPISADE